MGIIGNVPLTARLDDEVEVFEQKLEKLAYRIRVAVPGIIESFDPSNQLVSVRVAIRERLSFDGKPYEDLEIPLLEKVPIILPRAGNFVLTLPIAAGDECLLVFTDNCYDAWWESGQVSNQMDNRRHDLSDAVAIVGLWPNPKILSDYSTDSARLRSLDNSSYVEVKDTEINVVTSSKVIVRAETAEVSGTSKVDVKGGTVKISGSSVEIGNNTKIDGKNFLSHKHSGVQGGSSVSGGVV